MPTYVALIRFTEQGASNFKDTQKRATAFKDAAARAGVTVREQFWTLGAYDGVLVVDAPDDETVTGVMVGLSALGNVRTQTMRAFDQDEVGRVISRSAGGGGGGSGGAAGSGAASRGSKRGR